MIDDRPAIGIPVRLHAEDGTPDALVAAVDELFAAIVGLVRRSGAEPVLLEAGLRGIGDCDGFVVPGGGDVSPARYGGPADDPTLWGVSAEQDELDVAVLQHALDHGRPVLAICRGMQLLNVVLGGSLEVDVAESSVVHRLPAAAEFAFAVHDVQVEPGSRCAAAYGFAPALAVQSGHHQAVARIGSGLRPTAFAADGLVEGVETEDAGRWVVGVQWHPEVAAEEQRLPLFIALKEAAELGVTALRR
ncbi:MAG TPA: gamma-glutamyl-gamma-aminobutyrate hydrolase family protein [Amnibacterium sp.]|uniref:gamma-glutamyl-gamma-aminobutyrate hydrolase family protein n=1 Tax=Amnibacterium sp. TaxID=1872496 RepID=UPI002F948E95